MAAQSSSAARVSFADSRSPFAGAENQAGFRLEEKAFSLFQPDVLLPAQYLATMRRKLNLEPEKRLMLAVLEDGIGCFQKHANVSRRGRRALFLKAEEWLMAESSDGLFSFESICDMLGFNPDYLRQGLLRWKEQSRRAAR